MSYVAPAVFSEASYDFLISAGFGFGAGIAWQLVLLMFGPRRRLPSIIASCLFGAGAAVFALYFVIGRTNAAVMRWYIAAGMLLGIALWRLAGWRLLRRALRALVRGIKSFAVGLYLVISFPARMIIKLFRRLKARRKKAQPPPDT